MIGYVPRLGQVRLRMGAVIEPIGGSPEGPIQTYEPPRPFPIMLKRFEIRDEEGNFVGNAAVILTLPDGRHFMTRLSDAGGNVSFPTEELDAAAKAVNLRDMRNGKITYTVSAPGKASVQGVFWDIGADPDSQVGLKEITLKPEKSSTDLLVPVLLLTVIGGGILYTVFK